MLLDNRPTKLFTLVIFVLGDLFLLFVLLVSFSSSGIFPYGRIFFYLILSIGASIWNVCYAYVILNCPTKVRFGENYLSVTWKKNRMSKYYINDTRITRIGSVKVIKIYDNKWKLPRLLFLNGWTKEYKSLIGQIELANT